MCVCMCVNPCLNQSSSYSNQVDPQLSRTEVFNLVPGDPHYKINPINFSIISSKKHCAKRVVRPNSQYSKNSRRSVPLLYYFHLDPEVCIQ